MNVFSKAVRSTADYHYSHKLRRTLATVTDTAYVRIDVHGAKLQLKTSSKNTNLNARSMQRSARRTDTAPGPIETLELLTPEADTLPPLQEDSKGRGDRWYAFRVCFANGVEDHLFLRIMDDESHPYMAEVLRAIWPVLREDCLRESVSSKAEAAANALLWMVSKKADSAVLIIDGDGQLIQSNEAGRDMLEKGHILREGQTGLCCANSKLTGTFQQAVKSCLRDDTEDHQEFIMFLDGHETVGRVPVSLSRYDCPNDGTPLVVAILPREPDRKRIESLATQMGLTPAEARVAALMQMGLSNRDAAGIAGLKEQTFITYSKRVLAKLNVGCRAEMAHMLTWQASVGRAL